MGQAPCAPDACNLQVCDQGSAKRGNDNPQDRSQRNEAAQPRAGFLAKHHICGPPSPWGAPRARRPRVQLSAGTPGRYRQSAGFPLSAAQICAM